MTMQASGQRIGWLVLAVVSLLGCREPKSDYTYPGCEIADGFCSRDITIACAVNAINDLHASCVQDSDCVDPLPLQPAEWVECVPVTNCRRRLVNVNEVEAFWNETRDELVKYCNDLNCGYVTEDACKGPPGEPACVDNHCRFVVR